MGPAIARLPARANGVAYGNGQWVAVGQESSGNNILISADPRVEWNHSPIHPFGPDGRGHTVTYATYTRGFFSVNIYLLYIGLVWIYVDMMNSADRATSRSGISNLIRFIPQLVNPATTAPILQDASADYLHATVTIVAPPNSTKTIYGQAICDISAYNIYLNDEFLFQQSPIKVNPFTGARTSGSVICDIYNLTPATEYTISVSATNILGMETPKNTVTVTTAALPAWWSRVNPASIAFFRATLPSQKDDALFAQLLAGINSYNATLIEKMNYRNFLTYMLYFTSDRQQPGYYMCQLLHAYIDLYTSPDIGSQNAGMIGLIQYMPLLMELNSAEATPPSAPANLTQGDTSFFNTSITWTADSQTVAFYNLRPPVVVGNTIYINSVPAVQQLLSPATSSFYDLSADTLYQFEVTAFNRLGEESSRAAIPAFRTPALPAWWSAYGNRPALLNLLLSFTKSQQFLAPDILDQSSAAAAIYRQTTILITPGQECIDSNEQNTSILQWLCFDLLTSTVQAEADEAGAWLINHLPFIAEFSPTRFAEITSLVTALVQGLPEPVHYLPYITEYNEYQTFLATYTPITPTDFIELAYFQWSHATINPFIYRPVIWLLFYLPHIKLIQRAQRAQLLAFLQTQPGAAAYAAPVADQSSTAAKNWRFQNIYYKSSIPACVNSVWKNYDLLLMGAGTQPYDAAVDALTLSLPPLLTIAPTAPLLTHVQVTYLSASIEWEIPTLLVTGYNVYLDTVLVSAAQTATAYIFYNLVADRSYHLEVTGILPSGQETPRARRSISTVLPAWWSSDRAIILSSLKTVAQSKMYLNPATADQESAEAALWRSEQFPTTIVQDCINYYTVAGKTNILHWLYFDLMRSPEHVEEAELWLIQNMPLIPGLDPIDDSQMIPIFQSLPDTPLEIVPVLLTGADYDTVINTNRYPLTTVAAYISFARFLYNSSYIITYSPRNNWLKVYAPRLAALQNRANLLTLLPTPQAFQAPFADQTSAEAAAWRFQYVYRPQAKPALLHSCWDSFDQMGSTDLATYNQGAQRLLDDLISLIDIKASVPTIIEVQTLYLSVMVDWEASAPKGYNVYLNGVLVSARQTASKYTNYNLSANTSYTIDITAISAFDIETEKASVTIRETRNVPSWWLATFPTVYTILSQLSNAERFLYRQRDNVPLVQTRTMAPHTLTLNSITVAGPTMIAPGSTGQLTLTFDPADSFFANLDYVTFLSSDITIATVTGTGLVTAISNGTVTITVRGGTANSVRSQFQIICGLTLDQLQATPAAIDRRLQTIYNVASFGTTLQDAAAYYEHQLNTTVNYANYINLAWIYADMIQSSDVATYNQGVGGLILRLPIARGVKGLIEFNDGGISEGLDVVPANIIDTADAPDGSIILPAPAIIKHSARLTHIEAGAFGGLRYLSFAGGPVYKVVNGNIVTSPIRDIYYVTVNGVDILLPSMPSHSSSTIFMPRNVAYIPRNYFAASPATSVSFPVWNDRDELIINNNALPAASTILVGSSSYKSYPFSYVSLMTYTADLSDSIVLVYSGIFYKNLPTGSHLLWVPARLRNGNGTTITFPPKLVALPAFFTAEPCTTYVFTNPNIPYLPAAPILDARIARNWESADTRTIIAQYSGFIYKLKYPGQAALGFTSFPIIGQTQTVFPSRVSFLNYPSGIQQPMPAIIRNPGALQSNTIIIPTYMSFTNVDMPDETVYYYGNLEWLNRHALGQSRIRDYNPQNYRSITLMAGASSLYANMFSNLTVLIAADLTGELTGMPLSRYVNYITIMGEITVIPAYTFQGCNALLNQPFTTMTAVGEYAFDTCSIPTLSLRQVSSIDISNNAFRNCAYLSSITINTASNLSIGDSAFTRCNQVTAMTLECGGTLTLTPSALVGFNPVTLTVTNITTQPAGGDNLQTALFTSIDSYTNLHFLTLILSTNLSLGPATRYQNLNTVTITSPSVTLSPSQFSGCQYLTDVRIDTITALPAGDPFAGCSRLAHVQLQFSSDVSGTLSTHFGGEIIEPSIGWISLDNLVSLAVRGGCITWPATFFYGSAVALTSLILRGIGSSLNTKFLTSDGYFGRARGYPSLRVLDLQFAGAGAVLSSPLANLPTLQSLAISGSVQVTSPTFLAGSGSQLNSLSLLANFTGTWASSFPIVQTVYVHSATPSVITPYLFINNTELRTVHYTTASKIGAGAFFGCKKLLDLREILIDGVTEIEDWAFANSGASGFITMPATITVLGSEYFTGCPNISTLNYLCDVAMFTDPTRIGSDTWKKINNPDRQFYRLTGKISITGGNNTANNTFPYYMRNNYPGVHYTYYTTPPLFQPINLNFYDARNKAINDILALLQAAYNAVTAVPSRYTTPVDLSPLLGEISAVITYAKTAGLLCLSNLDIIPDLASLSSFPPEGWTISLAGFLSIDAASDVRNMLGNAINTSNALFRDEVLYNLKTYPSDRLVTIPITFNLNFDDIYIDISSTSIIQLTGKQDVIMMDTNQPVVAWSSPVTIYLNDHTQIDISAGTLWYDISTNMGYGAATVFSWIHANADILGQGNSVNFVFNNSTTLIQYLDYKKGGFVDISSSIVMIFSYAMDSWTNSTLTIRSDRVKLYNNAFNRWVQCRFNLTISDIVGAGVYPGQDLFLASDKVTINSNRLLINIPDVRMIDMTGFTLADIPAIILGHTEINPQQTTNVAFSTYIPALSTQFTQGIPMIKFQSTETLQEFVLIGQPYDWFWCYRAPPAVRNTNKYEAQPYYYGKPTLTAPGGALDHGWGAYQPMVMYFINNDENDPISKKTGLSSTYAPGTFTYEGIEFAKASTSNTLLRAVKTQDLTGQGADDLLRVIGYKDPSIPAGRFIFSIITQNLVPPVLTLWINLILTDIFNLPVINVILRGLQTTVNTIISTIIDKVTSAVTFVIGDDTVVQGILFSLAVVLTVTLVIFVPQIAITLSSFGASEVASLVLGSGITESFELISDLSGRGAAKRAVKKTIRHKVRDISTLKKPIDKLWTPGPGPAVIPISKPTINIIEEIKLPKKDDDVVKIIRPPKRKLLDVFPDLAEATVKLERPASSRVLFNPMRPRKMPPLDAAPQTFAKDPQKFESVVSDIDPSPKIVSEEILDNPVIFRAKIDPPTPKPQPDIKTPDPIPRPIRTPTVKSPPATLPPQELNPASTNGKPTFGSFTAEGNVREKAKAHDWMRYNNKLKDLLRASQAGGGGGITPSIMETRALTLAVNTAFDIQSYIYECMYRDIMNDCTSAYDGSVLLWHYQDSYEALKTVPHFSLEQMACYNAIVSQPSTAMMNKSNGIVLIDSSLPSSYYTAAQAMIPPYIPAATTNKIANTQPWMFYDVAMNSTIYDHLLMDRAETGYPCKVLSMANPLNTISNYLWKDTYLGEAFPPEAAEINIVGLGNNGGFGGGYNPSVTMAPHTISPAMYRARGVKLCVQTTLSPVELNCQSELYLGSRKVNYNRTQKEAANRVYSGAKDLTILIPESIRSIPSYAFCSTDGTDGVMPFTIQNLYINSSVSKIDRQAFYRAGVQNLYLSGDVGIMSFADCGILKSVVFYDPIVNYTVNTALTVNLGPNASIVFQDNRVIISNYISATGDNGQQIPGAVLSALIDVMYTSNGLSIYAPPIINNTSVGTVNIYSIPYQSAEYYTYEQQGAAFYGTGVKTGAQTFFSITALSQLIIMKPLNVTTEARYYIQSYTALMMPAVTPTKTISIGDQAFANNEHLTTVKFPTNCTHIGNRAFAGTKSLETIVIPNSVISLGDQVFADSGLKQITIPPMLQTIGEGIFEGIENLTIVMATPPPAMQELLAQVPEGTVFYTPTQFHATRITSLILNGSVARADTPPNPPTDLAGVAYANRVYLTWNPPTSEAEGSAIDSYTLQVAGPTSSFIQQVTSPYILGGLINRTTYTVTLLAVNSTGQVSEPTASLTITPVPDPPTLQAQTTEGYSLFGFDLEAGESLVNCWVSTPSTLERIYVAGGLNIPTGPLLALAPGRTYMLINGSTELALQTYEGRDIPLTLVKEGSALQANGSISSADTALQVFTIDGQPVSHGDVLTFRNQINLPIEVIANDPDATITITGSELQEDGVHIVVVAVLASNGATIASYSVTVNLFVNTISFATVEALQSPISIDRVINSFLTDSAAIPAAVLLPRFLTEMDACKVPVTTQIELLVALLQQRTDLTAAINEALRSRGIRPNKSYPVAGFSILIPTSTTIDIDMKSPRLLLSLVAGQQYKVRAHYKGKFSKTVFSGVKARMEFVFQRDIVRTFQLAEATSHGSLIGATGSYFIPPPPGTTIRLFPEVGELTVGSSVRLTVIVRPSPILLNWSSSAPCVRVANGSIIAVAAGSAIITASSIDGSVRASSRVTVRPQ